MKKNDNRAAVVFLSSSVAGFLLFYLLPFLIGIYFSVVVNTEYGSYFGLTNYIELLGNTVFLKACRNTAVFTAVSVPLNMILSLGLAMLLNKKPPLATS